MAIFRHVHLLSGIESDGVQVDVVVHVSCGVDCLNKVKDLQSNLVNILVLHHTELLFDELHEESPIGRPNEKVLFFFVIRMFLLVLEQVALAGVQ